MLNLYFVSLQYYEMSYGLNVEMHKQVSDKIIKSFIFDLRFDCILTSFLLFSLFISNMNRKSIKWLKDHKLIIVRISKIHVEWICLLWQFGYYYYLWFYEPFQIHNYAEISIEMYIVDYQTLLHDFLTCFFCFYRRKSPSV